MCNLVLCCDECDAQFTIEHEMSEEHYKPRYCCFCGSEIIDDNMDDRITINEEWSEDTER